MKKIEIIPTIKEGVEIALVNYLSIVCTVALYVVTIWIPYLNVGTTIAMASLPAEMAKGNVVNPLFIFDGKYRKNMGEFFILQALMVGAIAVGELFGLIPGFVLGVAWSLATILFVDKDRNALEALRESNELTYGNKWRIFGTLALLSVGLSVVVSIVGSIFNIGHVSWLQTIGTIINVVVIVFFVPAILGAQAVIYKTLTAETAEDTAEAAVEEVVTEEVEEA